MKEKKKKVPVHFLHYGTIDIVKAQWRPTAPQGTGIQEPTAVTQPAGQMPHQLGLNTWVRQTGQTWHNSQGQLSIQVTRQVFRDEAGLASSKDIRVGVRSSDGNHGQT